jgi:putative membrane protein
MSDEHSSNRNEIEAKTAAVQPSDLASEYLSNERTFLAWVRTGIAVITLGFALAKVRVWLGEFHPLDSPNRVSSGAGESIPLGIGMLLFGGLLVVLAAWRFRVVNRQIRRGEVTADRWMIVLITILVVALSLVMTFYLITGNESVVTGRA